jgi:hypothetical protein
MKQRFRAVSILAFAIAGCSGSKAPASHPPGSAGSGGEPVAGSGGGPPSVPADAEPASPQADASPPITPDAPPAPPAGAPLLGILGQFTAADVPAMGPNEAPPIPRGWPLPTVMPMLPGMGLAQHPMLYGGEGYNAVFVVDQGKVVWTYTLGAPGEIDDLWMMSNGHVLVCFDQSVVEISPRKEVVWRYAPPAPAQVHSCQPIGLERVLVMQNDLPPKVIVIDKKTSAAEETRPLPTPGGVDPGGIHTQFRRFRLTGAGTYLAAWLKLDKVVEYDKDLKPIWTYAMINPWSAIRLRNGNTLITSESQRTVREVNPKSETVWEWKQSTDLPAGLIQQNTQSAERLENGNTIIFASRSPQSATRPNVQAIEVTPDKKVVWVLQDWKNLGQATTAQFLDQPGVPETPGDLQH